MTMITNRISERPTSSEIPMDCLWCWNYTYQTALWSKYVDGIEHTVGFKFSNGPIRTMLEFGCGSGGFLGEMATRGVVGICTAREISNAAGTESYLPYLRTVAARGLIAMHVSITSHQPFLSNSFDFIHCSWVLAYVPPTPRMYAMVFLEWDRLLTPGGLVVQQGAWYKRKSNAEMVKLYDFSKYLIENVLKWKLIQWKVQEDRWLNNKSVMTFVAHKPTEREPKDWSTDPFLLAECPTCFTNGDSSQSV
eukprot:CAMPEP_0170079740 /NCGR_PEP_ID=MMETSP0019_2-20121128/16043_1 /TAXON_ID=98059 /ORGANISM="Dinobryon sp., Strain UTEXLB2267" /LENGTH=249 /DNA_ID=CAMNT_0010293343 /DNA_START=251 /DNA_END=1000 /DNA_ORIENTATION=-